LPDIALFLYDGMTALDAVGPYEVLARLPYAEVKLVASPSGPTTSGCTGSMLLGAAGILQGKRATSHWAVRDYLRNFGAEPVAERVVIEGKVITAGGVSAGIDMALTLAAREAGEDEARALQLVIEYDPQPPYDSGSLEKAEPETKQRATEVLTRGVA
jgi:transcriptional regulator GlxA family with amidase domain